MAYAMSTNDQIINFAFRSTNQMGATLLAVQSGLNSLTAVAGSVGRGLSDAMSVTQSAALALGTASLMAFMNMTTAAADYQAKMAQVQAISGQSAEQVGQLSSSAQGLAAKYGMSLDSITDGLITLGRAGITNATTQTGVLEEGFKMAKLEGMDLNEALEDLITTTNLLNGQSLDMNSSDYVTQVQTMNTKLLTTSQVAPIDVKDVMDSLQYSGGAAAASHMDIDNLLATISAMGARGTKGSLAGTALRNFMTRDVTSTAKNALKSIGLSSDDLWEAGGDKMRNISDLKEMIDTQMKSRGMSTQEQIAFWSKFAGQKIANQLVKIQPSEVEKYQKQIEKGVDVNQQMNIILTSTKELWNEISASAQNFAVNVGSKVLVILNPILQVVKGITSLFSQGGVLGDIMGWLGAGGLSFGLLAGGMALFNSLGPSLAGLVRRAGSLRDIGKDIKNEFRATKTTWDTMKNPELNQKAARAFNDSEIESHTNFAVQRRYRDMSYPVAYLNYGKLSDTDKMWANFYSSTERDSPIEKANTNMVDMIMKQPKGTFNPKTMLPSESEMDFYAKQRPEWGQFFNKYAGTEYDNRGNKSNSTDINGKEESIKQTKEPSSTNVAEDRRINQQTQKAIEDTNKTNKKILEQSAKSQAAIETSNKTNVSSTLISINNSIKALPKQIATSLRGVFNESGNIVNTTSTGNNKTVVSGNQYKYKNKEDIIPLTNESPSAYFKRVIGNDKSNLGSYPNANENPETWLPIMLSERKSKMLKAQSNPNNLNYQADLNYHDLLINKVMEENKVQNSQIVPPLPKTKKTRRAKKKNKKAVEETKKNNENIIKDVKESNESIAKDNKKTQKAIKASINYTPPTQDVSLDELGLKKGTLTHSFLSDVNDVYGYSDKIDFVNSIHDKSVKQELKDVQEGVNHPNIRKFKKNDKTYQQILGEEGKKAADLDLSNRLQYELQQLTITKGKEFEDKTGGKASGSNKKSNKELDYSIQDAPRTKKEQEHYNKLSSSLENPFYRGKNYENIMNGFLDTHKSYVDAGKLDMVEISTFTKMAHQNLQKKGLNIPYDEVLKTYMSNAHHLGFSHSYSRDPNKFTKLISTNGRADNMGYVDINRPNVDYDKQKRNIKKYIKAADEHKVTDYFKNLREEEHQEASIKEKEQLKSSKKVSSNLKTNAKVTGSINFDKNGKLKPTKVKDKKSEREEKLAEANRILEQKEKSTKFYESPSVGNEGQRAIYKADEFELNKAYKKDMNALMDSYDQLSLLKRNAKGERFQDGFKYHDILENAQYMLKEQGVNRSTKELDNLYLNTGNLFTHNSQKNIKTKSGGPLFNMRDDGYDGTIRQYSPDGNHLRKHEFGNYNNVEQTFNKLFGSQKRVKDNVEAREERASLMTAKKVGMDVSKADIQRLFDVTKNTDSSLSFVKNHFPQFYKEIEADIKKTNDTQKATANNKTTTKTKNYSKSTMQNKAVEDVRKDTKATAKNIKKDVEDATNTTKKNSNETKKTVQKTANENIKNNKKNIKKDVDLTGNDAINVKNDAINTNKAIKKDVKETTKTVQKTIKDSAKKAVTSVSSINSIKEVPKTQNRGVVLPQASMKGVVGDRVPNYVLEGMIQSSQGHRGAGVNGTVDDLKKIKEASKERKKYEEMIQHENVQSHNIYKPSANGYSSYIQNYNQLEKLGRPSFANYGSYFAAQQHINEQKRLEEQKIIAKQKQLEQDTLSLGLIGDNKWSTKNALKEKESKKQPQESVTKPISSKPTNVSSALSSGNIWSTTSITGIKEQENKIQESIKEQEKVQKSIKKQNNTGLAYALIGDKWSTDKISNEIKAKKEEKQRIENMMGSHMYAGVTAPDSEESKQKRIIEKNKKAFEEKQRIENMMGSHLYSKVDFKGEDPKAGTKAKADEVLHKSFFSKENFSEPIKKWEEIKQNYFSEPLGYRKDIHGKDVPMDGVAARAVKGWTKAVKEQQGPMKTQLKRIGKVGLSAMHSMAYPLMQVASVVAPQFADSLFLVASVLDVLTVGETLLASLRSGEGILVAILNGLLLGLESGLFIALAPIIAITAAIYLMSKAFDDGAKKNKENVEKYSKEYDRHYKKYAFYKEQIQKTTGAHQDYINKMKQEQLQMKGASAGYSQSAQLEAKDMSDGIWGEYGLRAKILNSLGQYNSDDLVKQYQDTSGEIRSIRLSSDRDTGYNPYGGQVADYYDSHAEKINTIDVFQSELATLYNTKNALIEKYGTEKKAEQSDEYKDAKSNTMNKTRMTSQDVDNAEKFLLQNQQTQQYAANMKAWSDADMGTTEMYYNAALQGQDIAHTKTGTGLATDKDIGNKMLKYEAQKIYNERDAKLRSMKILLGVMGIYYHLTANDKGIKSTEAAMKVVDDKSKYNTPTEILKQKGKVSRTDLSSGETYEDKSNDSDSEIQTPPKYSYDISSVQNKAQAYSVQDSSLDKGAKHKTTAKEAKTYTDPITLIRTDVSKMRISLSRIADSVDHKGLRERIKAINMKDKGSKPDANAKHDFSQLKSLRANLTNGKFGNDKIKVTANMPNRSMLKVADAKNIATIKDSIGKLVTSSFHLYKIRFSLARIENEEFRSITYHLTKLRTSGSRMVNDEYSIMQILNRNLTKIRTSLSRSVAYEYSIMQSLNHHLNKVRTSLSRIVTHQYSIMQSLNNHLLKVRTSLYTISTKEFQSITYHLTKIRLSLSRIADAEYSTVSTHLLKMRTSLARIANEEYQVTSTQLIKMRLSLARIVNIQFERLFNIMGKMRISLARLANEEYNAINKHLEKIRLSLSRIADAKDGKNNKNAMDKMNRHKKQANMQNGFMLRNLGSGKRVTPNRIRLEGHGVRPKLLGNKGIKFNHEGEQEASSGDLIVSGDWYINTSGDPDELKSQLMQIFEEISDRTNPKVVSQTSGTPPAVSTASSTNGTTTGSTTGTTTGSTNSTGSSYRQTKAKKLTTNLGWWKQLRNGYSKVIGIDGNTATIVTWRGYEITRPVDTYNLRKYGEYKASQIGLSAN